MNMGAFAIIAFVRNATGSEQIADYAGSGTEQPGVGGLFFSHSISV